ncbi:uncharacterized protein LOC119732779 [Patiria miniata]|uniref:ZAD domain-containing protein n=1 Tax=Patiria miniata TaxID=46514 RepID=A0A914AF26_PATMI|nr:uncharacterized protein LOC119732779 [Patiria miniata]
MEGHINALAMMCRICGQIITSAKNKSSSAKYKTQLLAVYNLNLDEEQGGIHPPSVCNKCRQQVQRAHSSMEQGKQYQGKLPQIQNFSAHDAACWVCSACTAHVAQLRPQFAAHQSSSSDQPDQPESQPSTSAQDPASSQPSLSTATRTLFRDTAPDPGMASHGKKRVWASLNHVRRDYAHKRTKEASVFISDFCERQKEDKLDLLYFLLCDNPNECGDSRYKEVLASWSKESV